MSLFDSAKCTVIVSRINKLAPENKAAWGKMNAGQMICHCADVLKMATGEREVADKSNFLTRTIAKPLIIYILPFPKNVPTAREIDQMRDGSAPTDFETDRRDLVNCIEKAFCLPNDFAWPPHPIFGKLSRRQWGLIIHKHLEHHLKQFGV